MITGYIVFETYLDDEFITSCMCSICKTELGSFEKFQNHIKVVIVHGLLKCQTCCSIWNKDVNIFF